MSGPLFPESMRAQPFTVAQLRDAGLPPSRLRHRSLHIPTRAVRSVDPVDTLLERAAAFAKALPADAAFSHATAAVLLGLPIPGRFEKSVLLDVMRDSSRTPIRRKRCVGHRGLESRRVTEVSGVRVVAPADTWADLGDLVRRGLTVDDLVVVGDAVVTILRPEDATLADVLVARGRSRGVVALEEALPLVRPGVRSPMESRARLMFHRAGFPPPDVNAVIRDSHGGWLLEGDLVWRSQRVIGEYQGVDHGSIRRRSADSSRTTQAEGEGYRVLEIYAEDVYRGARRRACLLRFARELSLNPADLRID